VKTKLSTIKILALIFALAMLLAAAGCAICQRGEPLAIIHYGYEYADDPPKYCIPLYSAQLVHDGSVQTIELEVFEEWGYRLNVKDKDGGLLWQIDASTTHAGWNTLFLTRIGDKEYLTQYNPVMYQGVCNYRFKVFSLGSDGEEILFDSGEADFSINPPGGGMGYFRNQDIEPIKAFYTRLNQYLPDSDLLFNTDWNVDDMLPEEYRGRVYGTQWAPITGVSAVFYGGADLSIDEQMDMFLSDILK